MKLDPRILEGKKPFSVFSTEEAREFIGEKGYFTDLTGHFRNIKDHRIGTLQSIDQEATHTPFWANFTDWPSGAYDYFLPAEWVKPEEPKKKYRPYTVMEFIKDYPLGSHLHFRPKDQTMEMHKLITGYNDCLNGSGTLFLDNGLFSLLRAYEDYELFKDGVWQPFGIEDKE